MGYFACYVSSFLSDCEDVYAVESNPRFCDAIHHSIRLNGFSKLKVYNAVLSDRFEAASIEDTAVIPRSSAHTNTRKNIVQTIPLDDLCQRERISPNIVKIDVHGAEGKVLMGMQRLLRDILQFVILELHPADWLEKYSVGVSRAELLALLEQCGFNNFYVAGHRYKRSDGLRHYLETGTFSYVPLSSETKDLLLFDRNIDILVLSSKMPNIESILGRSATDPSLLR